MGGTIGDVANRLPMTAVSSGIGPQKNMVFTFAKLVVAHYILTFWGLHVESTIFDPAASNPSTSSEYSETSKSVRNPEVWTSRGSRNINKNRKGK